MGSLAAVATDDSRVHLYSLADASSPQHTKTIELRANATALAFPPDEATKVLAVGLATGKVPLYSTESGEIVQARCVAGSRLLHSSVSLASGLTAP